MPINVELHVVAHSIKLARHHLLASFRLFVVIRSFLEDMRSVQTIFSAGMKFCQCFSVETQLP